MQAALHLGLSYGICHSRTGGFSSVTKAGANMRKTKPMKVSTDAMTAVKTAAARSLFMFGYLKLRLRLKNLSSFTIWTTIQTFAAVKWTIAAHKIAFSISTSPTEVERIIDCTPHVNSDGGLNAGI